MSHSASTPVAHGSAHGAELPPGHFHHMEPEQAYHSDKLGMWVFLATEVHLFGGLFCCFAIFRWQYLHAFNECARGLNWKLGALNTAVLLTSSYFMVRAVDAAQKGLNKKVKRWCDATLVCAFMFLCVKYVEWSAKFEHHLYPGSAAVAGKDGRNIFYGLYFTMTGLHGVHVIVGIGLIFWLRMLAAKNRFSVTYYTPVEVIGLYWHLVDVVWIYLFPLYYLMGGVGQAVTHTAATVATH